ncbi:MAG: 5-(carboxyamino)imidazole ribonucleotide mutase [Candidatus Eisenbacteria bacterium]|uniref:N5-carboxyaminoimidazole ribonucleotide mutase n=1 Tax=Eiseniibacteriota bacterium TaxID=2212470 RepID=A0A538SAB7_UNCEI|nr:MAG: 5-(carboxyamino)imidazole ribonucleotide mutase [Candidatus Eisenbacteria bacterium]
MTEKRPGRGPRIEVGVVMGSESDRPTMEEAVRVLDEFGVGSELVVRSAHRAPDAAASWARSARERGLRVIIAGAGGAAHLAGAMAAHSRLPVLGVPLASSPLGGFDALLSTVQMPPGVPVGTLAVGSWGARNAAHLAVRILALSDPSLMRRIEARAGGAAPGADAGRSRDSRGERGAAPGRRGAAGKRPPRTALGE